jgi:hypothetical protein
MTARRLLLPLLLITALVAAGCEESSEVTGSIDLPTGALELVAAIDSGDPAAIRKVACPDMAPGLINRLNLEPSGVTLEERLIEQVVRAEFIPTAASIESESTVRLFADIVSRIDRDRLSALIDAVGGDAATLPPVAFAQAMEIARAAGGEATTSIEVLMAVSETPNGVVVCGILPRSE